MNTIEARSEIERLLASGVCIAIAGNPTPGIPTIQALPEAEHCGFGYFIGSTKTGKKFSFDGGGAMRSVYKGKEWLFCWTSVTGKEAYPELGLSPVAQQLELDQLFEDNKGD
jgi:hypothetical protein